MPRPRVKPRVPKKFLAAIKKKKKRKKKHKFNPDQLAVLLNKIDKDPASRAKPNDSDGSPARGEFDSPNGNDLEMSASEVDWLRQRIEQCWNPPVGVREAERLIVKVEFEMDLDGNVLGVPRVLNSSANPLFQVAADSAVRAVLGCQPYAGLPPEKYELWRDNTLTFDPSRMLAVN